MCLVVLFTIPILILLEIQVFGYIGSLAGSGVSTLILIIVTTAIGLKALSENQSEQILKDKLDQSGQTQFGPEILLEPLVRKAASSKSQCKLFTLTCQCSTLQ